MSIFEGEKFTINEVNVLGDMPIDEEVYQPIIESLKDTTYSQAQITSIEEYFTSLLGNQGYTLSLIHI